MDDDGRAFLHLDDVVDAIKNILILLLVASVFFLCCTILLQCCQMLFRKSESQKIHC